jgi:hypothetical protein
MMKELIAGGTAGAIGIAIGNPFDVIKVRMQTMPDKYHSAIECARHIIKSDGMKGFFRGVTSPLVAQFIMNSIIFTTNSVVMRILEADRARHSPGKPLNVLIAGCAGGLTSCLILVPTDVVKCSLQVETALIRSYESPIQCAYSILHNEGIGGLYKGFATTALREIPAFGIYFSCYNYFLKIGTQPKQKPSTITILTAGGLAGCLSWLSVYPVDVVKSNIQAFSIVGHEKGFVNTASSLYRKHGWKIFTRGLGVTMLRAFPVNAAVFYFYELFKLQLDYIHEY